VHRASSGAKYFLIWWWKATFAKHSDPSVFSTLAMLNSDWIVQWPLETGQYQFLARMQHCCDITYQPVRTLRSSDRHYLTTVTSVLFWISLLRCAEPAVWNALSLTVALLRHWILQTQSQTHFSAILLPDHCLSPCFRFMIFNYDNSNLILNYIYITFTIYQLWAISEERWALIAKKRTALLLASYNVESTGFTVTSHAEYGKIDLRRLRFHSFRSLELLVHYLGP